MVRGGGQREYCAMVRGGGQWEYCAVVRGGGQREYCTMVRGGGPDLSVEVGEVLHALHLPDSLPSSALRRLDDHGVADPLRPLGENRGDEEADPDHLR